MKYHIVPSEIKKKIDVIQESYLEFIVAGAICLLALAIYDFFTGNGLLAGIIIFILFFGCGLSIRKTARINRGIYEKKVEFGKDKVLVWSVEGSSETIACDRICAIEDRELKIYWDRGYSLYDASAIECRLVIIYLDGVCSFDELKWQSEKGGVYKMSEIYKDKRCLVLPYAIDIMEHAVGLWQKGQKDRLNRDR